MQHAKNGRVTAFDCLREGIEVARRNHPSHQIRIPYPASDTAPKLNHPQHTEAARFHLRFRILGKLFRLDIQDSNLSRSISCSRCRYFSPAKCHKIRICMASDPQRNRNALQRYRRLLTSLRSSRRSCPMPANQAQVQDAQGRRRNQRRTSFALGRGSDQAQTRARQVQN